MAYTALAAAVTGDLWTAANHNTYIKDNFAAGVPDIFTAAGDIAYATAENAAAALAVGTAGQILAVNAGATALEWIYSMRGCLVHCTTDQEITSATGTKISFDTEIYDHSDFWSDTDSDAIVIPWDGVYQCAGMVNFSVYGSAANLGLKIGGTSVGNWSSSASAPGAYSFCYIARFDAGTDVYLNPTVGSTNASLYITRAEYSVTYLGAST